MSKKVEVPPSVHLPRRSKRPRWAGSHQPNRRNFGYSKGTHYQCRMKQVVIGFGSPHAFVLAKWCWNSLALLWLQLVNFNRCWVPALHLRARCRETYSVLRMCASYGKMVDIVSAFNARKSGNWQASCSENENSWFCSTILMTTSRSFGHSRA